MILRLHAQMNYTLQSGSHEEQGRRDTMEDTHVHLDVVRIEANAPWTKISYYGVYDGHGGVCLSCELVNTRREQRPIL